MFGVRRPLGLGALMASVVGLAGCETMPPHNDVLIFGTTTKLGIDIEAPTTSSAIPQFNVGYNRKESVWMPLSANTPAGVEAETFGELLDLLNQCQTALKPAFPDDTKRQQACITLAGGRALYVGESEGISLERGGQGKEKDTYSVFASFGAKGGLSGASASGGLAQFFATGIAAQRLGANPYVSAALTTDSSATADGIAAAEVGKSANATAAAERYETNLEMAKRFDAGCFLDEEKLATLRTDPATKSAFTYRITNDEARIANYASQTPMLKRAKEICDG